MHGQLSTRNPTTAQTLSVVARFYFRQLQKLLKLLKLVEPPGMTTSDFATTYLVHILHLLPHAIRIKAFEALEHPESTRRDVNRNTRKKEKDHWWCVLIISGHTIHMPESMPKWAWQVGRILSVICPYELPVGRAPEFS